MQESVGFGGSVVPVVIRANGMNAKGGRQIATDGHFRATCVAPDVVGRRVVGIEHGQCLSCVVQHGPTRLVHCPVDTTAAEQSFVGGVHRGVSTERDGGPLRHAQEASRCHLKRVADGHVSSLVHGVGRWSLGQ